MERVTWLDGLRGLAAINSVLRHAWFMEPKSVFGFLFRSYWAEPREANRHIIELPLFRLLFASSSWVTCFMVLCGAAISTPVIHSRKLSVSNSENGLWLNRLCSQITRRWFRLYLPVICVSFLSNFLFFCNIITYPQVIEVMQKTWNLQPLMEPWAHIKFSVWQVLHLMTFTRYELDIANTLPRDDLESVLNAQLWSIPVVFRGSLMIYILLLATALWRPQPRRLAFITVSFYWFYTGQWDIFAFTSGLCVAEHLYGESNDADRRVQLSSDSDSHTDSDPNQSSLDQKNMDSKVLKSSTFSHCLWTPLLFLVALFLLSIPDDGPLGADYHFLTVISFSPWWDRSEIFNRLWTGLGATMLLIAIGRTEWLQYPLNSRPLQFLGRISYPMYVIHIAVYFVVKWPLQNFFWFIATREWYPGSEEASQRTAAFTFTWIGWILTSMAIIVILGDLCERYIDRKLSEFVRRFEAWVTQKQKL